MIGHSGSRVRVQSHRHVVADPNGSQTQQAGRRAGRSRGTVAAAWERLSVPVPIPTAVWSRPPPSIHRPRIPNPAQDLPPPRSPPLAARRSPAAAATATAVSIPVPAPPLIALSRALSYWIWRRRRRRRDDPASRCLRSAIPASAPLRRSRQPAGVRDGAAVSWPVLPLLPLVRCAAPRLPGQFRRLWTSVGCLCGL
jgi:hypothetical protein